MRNKVLKSNRVTKDILREVQKDTLQDLKEALFQSAGPYGSTTQIIPTTTDNGKQTAYTEYTKDGHTILEGIQYNMSIENSIQKELTELTRYITIKVGDGTTSAIVLSSLIFDQLCELEKEKNFAPYKLINTFKSVADKIKERILTHGRALDLQDVYKIAMICTNSNDEVSNILQSIYDEHGLDVFIDVGISNSEDHIVKSYSGLTLESGYSDAAYINSRSEDVNIKTDPRNNKVGKCVIRNANIYAFVHPIDTIEMATLFGTIVTNNVFTPYQNAVHNNTMPEYVPTVILAPKISIDNSDIMKEIVSFMYSVPIDQKPPFLIVTNLNAEQEDIYSDILRLAGCKEIKKYIDPEIQKKEIEEGKAATRETINNFAGYAEEVVADVDKTVFINPEDMYVFDDNGDKTLSPVYTSQIAFLETELAHLNGSDDINTIGNLKRRIHYLKANMADFLVGGVTVTDRDSVRALVEDAVKNIRSCAQYGVGYGANFEGLRAVTDLINESVFSGEELILADGIKQAYINIAKALYATGGYSEDGTRVAVRNSLTLGRPMNLVTNEYDGSVLCTIMEDVTILDVISKILTIMFTSNQSLLQNTQLNLYQ